MAREDRSDAMILIAYFYEVFAETRERGRNRPPQELQAFGIDSFAGMCEYLYPVLGGIRTPDEFANSMHGQRQGFRQYINGTRQFSRRHRECEVVARFWGRNDPQTRAALWSEIEGCFQQAALAV